MTKVGRLIFEDGVAEGEKRGELRGEQRGEKKQRIIAVMNMFKLGITEPQILEMYSEEDLEAAKEALKEKV